MLGQSSEIEEDPKANILFEDGQSGGLRVLGHQRPGALHQLQLAFTQAHGSGDEVMMNYTVK